MTPDESLALLIENYGALGVDRHAIRCLWALRVLDAWRALDRSVRSWTMAEGEDVKLDTCTVLDAHATEFSRPFHGTSADAARMAAATALATEDPDILLSV